MAVCASHYLDGREEVLTDNSGSGGGASVMAFSHDAHRAVLSDFLDAIEQNRDPAIPGEEALATQRIIDAILTKGGVTHAGPVAIGRKLGARLKARGETIAIAESSTGGLISAALLSVAGASRIFPAGSVIYTHYARAAFLDIPNPCLTACAPPPSHMPHCSPRRCARVSTPPGD